MFVQHPLLRRALTLGVATCLLSGLVAATAVQAAPVTAPLADAAAPSDAYTAIAKVTLVVGDAQRVQPNGQRQPLQMGAQLAEQDRIITGKDALVMLVFSDSGRVAIRPDTELIIRHYRIDPSGADTRLDLELLRGTIRQISGQAAKLQPERYRLNTPIAAIGVRGTDFLARVEQDQIQTYVHEGSIVVLPPLSECGAHRAACLIWAAVNASDAGQYVAVRGNGQVTRSSASPEDVSRLFGIRIAAAREATPATQQPQSASTDPRLQGAAGLRPDGQDLHPIVVPTATAPATPADPPAQLVWGRFADPTQLPFTLPVSYQQASAGRHVTVGQISQYALWRDNPGGQLDTSLRGQAEFALKQSEAYYTLDGVSLPVHVSNATLAINFDKSTFATQLGLSGAGVPATSLQVGGRMNDEGIFTGSNAQGQRVAGALSRSATEAAYFFTAAGAGAAQYEGITTWRGK